MFSFFAQKTVGILDVRLNLVADDKELYTYGFYLLFSKIYCFLLCIVFGCLFQVLFESIVFFVLFSSIRSYAGGTHAKSELLCTIFTTASLFVVNLSIRMCTILGNLYAPLFALLLSAAIISIHAPLDSVEKPLTPKEKRKFQIVSISLTVVAGAIALISLIASMKNIFYACTMSLTLEAILILIECLKRRIAK